MTANHRLRIIGVLLILLGSADFSSQAAGNCSKFRSEVFQGMKSNFTSTRAILVYQFQSLTFLSQDEKKQLDAQIDALDQIFKDAEREAERQVAIILENARVDKMITGSGSGQGTSLTSDVGLSELLGLAIENGIVQKDQRGTMLTLRTTPYAFIAAGEGGNTQDSAKQHDFLRRISLFATFNIGQEEGESPDVLAGISRRNLKQWGAAFRLKGDERKKEDIACGRLAAGPAQAVTSLTGIENDAWTGVQSRVVTDVSSFTKSQQQQYVLEASTFMREVQGLLEAYKRRVLRDIRPAVVAEARRLAGEGVTAARQRLLSLDPETKEEGDKTFFTFEYLNNRIEQGSDFSEFKLDFRRQLTARANFIFNGSISIHHEPSQMQERIRDFAFAFGLQGEVANPFRSSEGDDAASQLTWSLNGRYERKKENREMIMAKDIALTQFKLDIPLARSLRLPFSVTWANATELVKESHVFGAVGLTFDLDSLR